jgi:electron transfer flavoprotein alpha subunit
LVDRVRSIGSGPIAPQVRLAVEFLKDRGVLLPEGSNEPEGEVARPSRGPASDDHAADVAVAVIAEPSRSRSLRELLGGAARLARQLDGRVTVLGVDLEDASTLSSWGADDAVRIAPPTSASSTALVEEDVAGAVATWVAERCPAVVLTGSTAWGREVASRVAASIGAGLTGDAVGLTVERGRLVAWKPAFGGTLVAAITSSSASQMATVRPGVLRLLRPRAATELAITDMSAVPRGRVVVHAREREDDIDALANADVVIGVGAGVEPDEYHHLESLRSLLGAELAATRKVTDKGWMPHARQIGITGYAISPRLYLALGTSGKYNHTVGVRSAGTIIAVNPDPDAPVFGFADIGIVGDWRETVDELERQLRPLVS